MNCVYFRGTRHFVIARLRLGNLKKNTTVIYLNSFKGATFQRRFLHTDFNKIEGKEVGMELSFKEAFLLCVINLLHTTSPPDLPSCHHTAQLRASTLPSSVLTIHSRTFFKTSFLRSLCYWSFSLQSLSKPHLKLGVRHKPIYFYPLFKK